ncbi:hypothetical protein ACFX2A_025060 [Malus domestica]
MICSIQSTNVTCGTIALSQPPGQKQMCQHYAQGRCYYGDRCKFSHEMKVREEKWFSSKGILGYHGDSGKFSNKTRENYRGTGGLAQRRFWINVVIE